MSLAPLLAGPVSVISGARFVQESERGVKLRFGKVVRYKTGPRAGQPKIIHPGFCFVIPTMERLHRVHTRQDTLNLDTQQVILKDRTSFRVSSAVVYKVMDDDHALYQALFEVTNLRSSIENHCLTVLQDVLGDRRHEEVIGELATLSAQIATAAAGQLAEWGIELVAFRLTDCSPDADTQRMLLSVAAATFRAEALRTAAGELGTDVKDLDPRVAAALVGVPVVASLGGGLDPARHQRRAQRDDDEGDYDEDDEG